MPIRFRCAYCNQLMGISRRKAGQVVKCPKCAGEIIVPVPEGTEQPEATEQPANLGGAFDAANFDPAAEAAPQSATAPAEQPAEPVLPPPPAPKRFGVFLSIGMLFICIFVIVLLLILMFVLGLIIGGQKGAPPDPKGTTGRPEIARPIVCLSPQRSPGASASLGDPMRVGIIALLQESNTFIAGATTLAHFEQDVLLDGDAVRTRFADAHHEVGGFFGGLAEEQIDAVPIFAARALPYGIVAAEAFDALLERMDAALDRAGPIDGLLVAPHGATVAANHADADGHWLTRLRQRFGRKLPIIGTLDLHANLSPKMVAACDALIGYRTNPHLDQRQRGIEAAKLMARTLRGEIKPTMAAAFPPLAINIERQLTAEKPCRTIYAYADAMLADPGVLSNSLILSFPYADVPEMGAGAIVVTDSDFAQAASLVADLEKFWWERREEFVGRMISIDEALNQAAKLEGPITLLDMGDNVGGGSPGDGTELAHALDQQPALAPAFVCLNDPESVQQISSAGIGATIHLRVGGKTDNLHGKPFEADFIVKGLHDGKFQETEPRHGGFLNFDQGPTAVALTPRGLTIMLTTRRMVPFSIKQLTSCGLDPAAFRILVAKGVHAPVAAYAPVSKHLIRVDTPGVTSADLSRLEYRQRRRPMFPFEKDPCV